MTDKEPSDRAHEQSLLAHIADLELEVDRLRTHSQYLRQSVIEAATSFRKLQAIAAADADESRIDSVSARLIELADELRDLPVQYPANDQVVAMPLRPLIEQVFRWQQRFHNAPYVSLRMELAVEFVDWFPARLRHILDNLISNALRFRDEQSGQCRVTVSVAATSEAYEVRIADNGPGMNREIAASIELSQRSSPLRSAGTGVGLAVVKVLLDECGGALTLRTGDGVGTTAIATLPRFDAKDYLSAGA